MEALIEMVKPYIILFCILVVLVVILNSIIKSLTIAELISEKRAYNLIAEEEALEIENKKKREQREQELHKEQMRLIEKQKQNADEEQRRIEQAIRNESKPVVPTSAVSTPVRTRQSLNTSIKSNIWRDKN